jgi:hypothetical protein
MTLLSEESKQLDKELDELIEKNLLKKWGQQELPVRGKETISKASHRFLDEPRKKPVSEPQWEKHQAIEKGISDTLIKRTGDAGQGPKRTEYRRPGSRKWIRGPKWKKEPKPGPEKSNSEGYW